MSMPAAASSPTLPSAADRRRGLLFGLVGVACFSLTLPATRIAVAGLDPVFVGLGRAVVAAVLAGCTLAALRVRWPGRAALPGLAVVAAGVVVGFPLFTAWAMRHVPASHGAVVIGLLPLATALAGTWLAHERPTPVFWFCAVAGSAVVVAFAVWQGGGKPHPADGLLLVAVAAAAVGYAEGGRLARSLPGWQVISWVCVLALPITVPASALIWVLTRDSYSPGPAAWGSLIGIGVSSMYLGFFAWYRGLALAGSAHGGQVQQLQALLTLGGSAWLLDEHVTWAMVAAAAAVIGAVVWAQRSRTAGTAQRSRTTRASSQIGSVES
jgi:drug/metabolite transporter (DMT)-like permease